MQSPKVEFPELVVQAGKELGNVSRMSSVIPKKTTAKSISFEESFAWQLANDEAALQEWRENVQKLRKASHKAANLSNSDHSKS